MTALTPATPSAPTMQEVIVLLQQFWSEYGVLLQQPFNTEVGAGTANPATSLRVLGPEPWNVAYVEPSVRPDDSRYGENPNRLQTHTQYQVILKPDPGNPQEIYLASLEAIGIDTAANDIRFIEDNWASPALGAWGLGWEVWMNGMEITQFTYFQQAGGIALDPVSVEITYGLERIVMNLQGATHFKDIHFSDGPHGPISYGEIYGQAEYEMSRYYLDEADVELNRQLFESYAAEAERMLELQLPVPAYSYILKCSHVFNVLDARGAVSTTERARSFGLMRRLTHSVSQLWIARREQLGLPLGTVAPVAAPKNPEQAMVDRPSTLLVEIGVEELPHTDVRRAAAALHAMLVEYLNDSRLQHGEVICQSTPRRIVATVADISPAEQDVTLTVRGPRVTAAYDAQGEPTKALLGFLRSKNADPADIGRVSDNGHDYVAVAQHVVGRSATQIVSAAVEKVVRNLHADKNMRWNDPVLSFSRPIRWLLVLLGEIPVHVSVSGLASGTTTRVLRTAPQPIITIRSADDYAEVLAGHSVILDRERRRALVVAGAQGVAGKIGGTVDVVAESALVDEITDITEDPRPVLGSFDEAFLELPTIILTTVMRKHQRYLPVSATDGSLAPYFVTFTNGPCDIDRVRIGNESVIRARYDDASFFWNADLKISPAQFRSQLGQLLFEEKLGTFDERVTRISDLADGLLVLADLAGTDTATVVRRAAALGKFDLASQIVTEFSGLAGSMAWEYALRAGEPAEVALAIAEMEMPRSSTSAAPTSVPGAILSLADRFDLLTSMYAIGAIPTGTADPYGVRRTALGVVRVLRDFPALAGITISGGIDAAAQRLAKQGIVTESRTLDQAAEFVRHRYELQLIEQGHPHRLVRAILPVADCPARADALLTILNQWSPTGTEADPGATLVQAIARVVRILPDQEPAGSAEYSTRGLDPAELALSDAVESLEKSMAGQVGDLAKLFVVGADLAAAVSTFFDNVHVMTDDPALRTARVRLLRRIVEVAVPELDWKAL